VTTQATKRASKIKTKSASSLFQGIGISAVHMKKKTPLF